MDGGRRRSVVAVIGPSQRQEHVALSRHQAAPAPGGSILVNGQPLPQPHASTGLVLQDYGLLPWSLTVYWDLVMHMGRFYQGKRPAADGPRPCPAPDIPPEQVDRWLTRLGIAEVRRTIFLPSQRRPRQRTAITRSLLSSPTCCNGVGHSPRSMRSARARTYSG